MAIAGEHDKYHAQWEGMWSAGLAPGQAWDARHSAPSLVKLLNSSSGPATSGKSVVVPGCGRGYDLVTFAAHGASRVVGVEISEAAAGVAREYVATQAPSQGKDVSVAVEDWLSTAGDLEQFDLGYDYTFFCALHPSMRESWAEAWARRIKPGGALVALAFPIENSDRIGPPWPLKMSYYEQVLEPRGFKRVKEEQVAPADATVDNRAGREIMTVWEKTS